MERYFFFLQQRHDVGDSMAESRGGKEDMRLKKSYEGLFETGTEYIGPDRFAKTFTSAQLKVKSKQNNISGLQLADLIAHPSRREILLENGKITDNRNDIFADRIVEILQGKYYARGDKVLGHGKKLLQ